MGDHNLILVTFQIIADGQDVRHIIFSKQNSCLIPVPLFFLLVYCLRVDQPFPASLAVPPPYGEVDRKATSFARHAVTFNIHTTAVQVGQLLNEEFPNPTPVPSYWRVRLLSTCENGTNSDLKSLSTMYRCSIQMHKNCMFILLRCHEPAEVCPVIRSEFHRIRQSVDQDLLETPRVGIHFGDRRILLIRQRNGLAGCLLFHKCQAAST